MTNLDDHCPSLKPNSDPNYWLERASSARTKANHAPPGHAKRRMLKLPKVYEALAERIHSRKDTLPTPSALQGTNARKATKSR